MRRFLITTYVITIFLSSCTKIQLYPAFQSEEETVFLVNDTTTLHKVHILENAACSLKFAADSLWETSDSLHQTADSLYHIADSLLHAVDSLNQLLYSYDGMEPVNVLPSGGCTVFIPFSYTKETKSNYNIYDLHAFKGRARHNETVLGESSVERDKFFSHRDDLAPMSRPHYPLIPWHKRAYYLELTIPENTSFSSQTISFDYSYQTNALFNRWSDWMYISSIKQDGQL